MPTDLKCYVSTEKRERFSIFGTVREPLRRRQGLEIDIEGQFRQKVLERIWGALQ